MPDAAGNFRGIRVTKLWPGHRDYEPPKPEIVVDDSVTTTYGMPRPEDLFFRTIPLEDE